MQRNEGRGMPPYSKRGGWRRNRRRRWGRGGGRRRRRGRRTRKGGQAKGPEASWMPLGVSWDVFLGTSWRRLGALLAAPGASWSVLDASGEHIGAFWGYIAGLLEASWALPGAILEAIDKKRLRVILDVPPSEPSNSPLGALLGCSGALLVSSWASLGPLPGPSWATLEPS